MRTITTRISPQAQLWGLTNRKQHFILRAAFKRLKNRDQQDLCYALIANLRFGVNRKFEDYVMQYFYNGILEALKEVNNANNKDYAENTI